MDEKLQKEIIRIANALKSEGSVWTRADLASELENFGIKSDSVDVAKYVYEAYCNTNNSSLKSSFVTNDGVSSLVDEYRLQHFRLEKQTDNLIVQMSEGETKANSALSELERALSVTKSTNSSLTNIEGSFGISVIEGIEEMSGAKAIGKCAEAAKKMFDQYTSLKTAYDGARNDVKGTVKDFVTVRQYVSDILDRQIRSLKDVFGESVVAVAPELFNFDRIEYLDVQKMYNQVKLEYDRLSETCPVLMNEVRTSFKDNVAASIGMGAKALQSGKNDALIGLALAAMNMYSAHLDAQKKVSECKSQLESLKQNIDYDVVTISADYARLTSIFKTINDIYVPATSAFCRKSEDILTSDIKEIYRTAYSDPFVAKLVKEREELLKERADIEMKLNDAQSEIFRCQSEILFDKNFIGEKKDEYEMALGRKPKKPSILSKMISFGNAVDVYNKNLTAWSESDGEVVSNYEKLKTEIKMNEEDLKNAESSKNGLKSRLSKINEQIKSYDAKITGNMNLTDEDKKKIATRLESVVKLLRVGKQIIESKIDESNVKAVNIQKFESDFLPTNISSNVSSFCRKYGIDNAVKEEAQRDIMSSDIDTQTKEVALSALDNVVDSAMDIMDNYVDLFKKRANGEIQLEYYRKQLQEIKTKFEVQMKSIDARSEVLGNIIAKINTSEDRDTMRDALILLGDTSFNLSSSDLDDIISGKKKIEI